MAVLVTYASKHGATAGIAERIGDRLARSGLEVTVAPAERAGDPTGFDGAVIGSAVYMGHWRKDAVAYVQRWQPSLALLPVWLFSSGPLGEANGEPEEDPREAGVPKELDELTESVRPREHRVFFGALNPDRLTLTERALRRLPSGKGLFPEGDFRDWEDIDGWADAIAVELEYPIGP